MSALERMPDNFDAGIIYGTRHPDWSSHPKRGEQNRSLSPVPVAGLPVKSAVVAGKKALKVDTGIDTRIGMSISPEETRRKAPSPPPLVPPPPAVDAETPSIQVSALSSDVEGAATPPSEQRGVTLVDHPLALPHHALMNSSRFSFEDSSKSPSAAQSQNGSDEPQRAPAVDDDDDDRSSFADGFQFDLDDEYDDDDGFERANEGWFENGLEDENDNEQDQYAALTAAVKAMDFNIQQAQQGIGIPVSSDGAVKPAVELAAPEAPVGAELPTMDPQPAEPTKKPSVSHRKPIANPRGLDLSDDSDLDNEDHGGLAGYEDDDDLYYDDGFISEIYGGEEEVQQPPQAPQKLTIQPPTNEATPAVSPPAEGAADGHATAVNRFSMTTGYSSGLVPQDGSMATQPEGPAPEFPPFINPIGGGLGFTPQQHQFYAPNVSGTMLNGYALSSLTATLQQYQLQQQLALAGAPQSPSEGYDSDINERPNFGDEDMEFYFDDNVDDDDAMVAAANADALAYDSEGFYGSEFGFYSSNVPGGGLSYAGGFFGSAGANDVLRPPIRRPSLTPISERSESSYRNSLVFPVSGGGGAGTWGSVGPLTPGSWGTDQAGATGGEEQLSLGQLLQLSSNGSSCGSPVAWPTQAMEPQKPMWSPPPPQPGESLTPEQMYLGVASTPPPPSPLQLVTTPSQPPGLQHAGDRAMLPTKGSFEDPAAVGGEGLVMVVL